MMLSLEQVQALDLGASAPHNKSLDMWIHKAASATTSASCSYSDRVNPITQIVPGIPLSASILLSSPAIIALPYHLPAVLLIAKNASLPGHCFRPPSIPLLGRWE